MEQLQILIIVIPPVYHKIHTSKPLILDKSRYVRPNYQLHPQIDLFLIHLLHLQIDPLNKVGSSLPGLEGPYHLVLDSPTDGYCYHRSASFSRPQDASSSGPS